MGSRHKNGKDDDDRSRDEDRHEEDKHKESKHKSSKHKDEKERKHKKKKKSDHKKDKKTKRSTSRDNNKSKKHKSKKRHRRKHSDRSSSRSRRSSEDSRSQTSSDLNSSSKESNRKRDKKDRNKNKDIEVTPICMASLPEVPNLSTQFGDSEGTDGKISLKEFQSYKKKVVISNLPLNASEDEILTFLNTYINTIRALTVKEGEKGQEEERKRNDSNVIDSIEIRNGIYRYGVIQIDDKDDIEHCTSIDGTEWKGQKIRVRRTKKFIEEYNKEIDKRLGLGAQNPGIMGMPGAPGLDGAESENKIYMGGIPTSMNSEDVRKICAAFGPLKSFNLVVDQNNKMMNRGFAFFEYSNDKDTEKAIRGLDGFEIMGKKLKIQKASLGAKPPAVQKTSLSVGFKNYIEPSQRIKIPLFALTPSRVVQFMNMITPEDLLDDTIKRLIFKDIVDICSSELSKDVVDIKAPAPDLKTGYCTKGVGKIFVKFNHIVAAKQARFHLSGRKYFFFKSYY